MPIQRYSWDVASLSKSLSSGDSRAFFVFNSVGPNFTEVEGLQIYKVRNWLICLIQLENLSE